MHYRHLRIVVAGVATIAALALARPAQAQTGFPTPIDAEEAKVLPALAEVVRAGRPTLATLDPLLAQLPRPTPLRGMVQTARSLALLEADRHPEARASAEEAVRLSPGRAYPRMIASYVLTFTGAPEAAAGYWLEASVLEPQIAMHTDEYALTALVGRLREGGQRPIADRLEARMAEIGVLSAAAPTRSHTAAARIRAAFTEGGAAAAQPMVSAILNPDDMMPFYVDRNYAALWPAIYLWAGDRFALLHARYIEELRREWWATGGYDAAVNYARALIKARRYDTVVALFLPMLSGEGARTYKRDMEFLAPQVGRALVAVGRGAEALATMDRVAALMPAGTEALKLNLSAATLTRMFEAQDWVTLAPRAQAWLDEARRHGPGINVSALLRVDAYRICALERSGRGSEAALGAMAIEAAGINVPEAALQLYACRGDLAGARTLVVRALDRSEVRAGALVMLQPETADPMEQPMTRELRMFNDRLRQDPEVRAAVSKVGRLLPYSVTPSLPDGFDPLLAGPRRAPVPGSI